MNINVPNPTAQRAERSNARAAWMRQLRTWHWISGAICLVTTMLFAITGLTLNHASLIEAKPAITVKEAKLDEGALAEVQRAPKTGRALLPAAIAAALDKSFGASTAAKEAEFSADEIYVSLPRPGGDSWMSIERDTGAVRYEVTTRGWIAYLNDLHKGRHTGTAWIIFIDVFAIACVVFCITGLLLLQMYAKGRPSTWPLVAFGVALPIIIAILFIH